MLVRNTVTNQRHQMPMMNTADDLNLGLKLTVALSASSFELLHRNNFTIMQRAFVDATKPAFSKNVVPSKALSYLRKLLVTEMSLAGSEDSRVIGLTSLATVAVPHRGILLLLL